MAGRPTLPMLNRFSSPSSSFLQAQHKQRGLGGGHVTRHLHSIRMQLMQMKIDAGQTLVPDLAVWGRVLDWAQTGPEQPTCRQQSQYPGPS